MDKASMTEDERSALEEFDKLEPREASFALVLVTLRLAFDEKTKLDDEQRLDIAMTLMQFYRIEVMTENTGWMAKMLRKYPRDTWPDLLAKRKLRMSAETISLCDRCKLFAEMIVEARRAPGGERAT
jgi:hypothetical protein